MKNEEIILQMFKDLDIRQEDLDLVGKVYEIKNDESIGDVKLKSLDKYSIIMKVDILENYIEYDKFQKYLTNLGLPTDFLTKKTGRDNERFELSNGNVVIKFNYQEPKKTKHIQED